MEEMNMSSTALGAEKAIIFISDAHEKFYYEKLKEVRYQDVYHKALVYCLGISDDTRRNIYSIYDFKTGCVKTECLHEGWQTSGSVRVVRMAFNLYCNGTPSVLDYTLFNAFNEDGFTIGGVKVDINPITEGKTGTLGEYLPGVEAYLEEKRATLQERSEERRVGKEC